MNVAVIICYFDPDYVRARSIRASLARLPDIQTIIVKNSNKSALRYLEIIWKLLRLRFSEKPDVYLLTFRGQEILPIVLLIAGKKPVIFDEFIVPIAYAKYEKHSRSPEKMIKHGLARLSAPLYRRWLMKAAYILSDTESHAQLSAKENSVPLEKYCAVPVSTDETAFQPVAGAPEVRTFQVFYYGNMLPLHGLPVVLDAAKLLKDKKDIEFVLVGGKSDVAEVVAEARQAGAHITYQSWVPFNELHEYIGRAGVCLGGPFGDTPQAQHVITGKTYQFLASSVPVIVGQNNATEHFVDKKNCLLVAQGDAQALAGTIAWAYEHRDALPEIGKRGRELYDECYSNKVVATLLEQLLRELS